MLLVGKTWMFLMLLDAVVLPKYPFIGSVHMILPTFDIVIKKNVPSFWVKNGIL